MSRFGGNDPTKPFPDNETYCKFFKSKLQVGSNPPIVLLCKYDVEDIPNLHGNKRIYSNMIVLREDHPSTSL
jgi:hypothetical protein